tara:strand:+ start:318 stop:431 length:114 start_codon:yes stop_codon:yes gene_type:complete
MLEGPQSRNLGEESDIPSEGRMSFVTNTAQRKSEMPL